MGMDKEKEHIATDDATTLHSSNMNIQGEEETEPESEPEVILEGRARNTSDAKTCVNILKSYMGSGLLGLPYAFREGGVIGSLVIMPILGFISVHCMYILVKSKQMLVRDGHTNLVTYGDIANHCYGRIGEYIVNFMLIFTQFGFCCVYVVYVASNLQPFLPGKKSKNSTRSKSNC
jgi:solute carrier family 36 (proton-coupled amino acid transporter)